MSKAPFFHLDLFSGIGGFALAARWVGFETVQFVEYDNKCQMVLQKNFPGVAVHGDVRSFNGYDFNEKCKKQFGARWETAGLILTGGFPCQPYSFAGLRKGQGDDRALWPEMLRIIRETKPSHVVCENVPGLISLALDQVLSDLEGEGYACETFVLPAAGLGAVHIRERVWVLAYALKRRREKDVQELRGPLGLCPTPPAHFCRLDELKTDIPKRNHRELRVHDGIPNWMDRIGMIGNAIDTRVVYEIFKAVNSQQSIYLNFEKKN